MLLGFLRYEHSKSVASRALHKVGQSAADMKWSGITGVVISEAPSTVPQPRANYLNVAALGMLIHWETALTFTGPVC
jgi:PAB1-binding protein PBP1